jgi:plastocyanin
MTKKQALLLAILVALASQCIDAIIHLQMDIALHIPYMAVKMSAIGFTFFWYYYWIGRSRIDNSINAILATSIFYLYYSFAEATLDRTVFTLDEASIFIFIHWVAIIIPMILVEYLVPVTPPLAKFMPANPEENESLVRYFQNIVLGGLVVGALLMFPSKTFLVNNGLILGVPHNEHVMGGTFAFILAAVAVVKIMKLQRPKQFNLIKSFVFLAVTVFVLGLGYWGIQDRWASVPVIPAPADYSQDVVTPSADSSEAATSETVPGVSQTVLVTFGAGNFTPKIVNIKVGDTVKWVNKHIGPIRVVSNPHPFHTSFPALDSDTLDPNAEYSFTFKEKVTVNYHNHFNPGVTGQIIVE